MMSDIYNGYLYVHSYYVNKIAAMKWHWSLSTNEFFLTLLPDEGLDKLWLSNI